MSKLCVRIGATTKKYDLKDSVNESKKLAVRVGSSTKYLGLKAGTKSGELSVRIGSQTYYVQTLKEPEEAPTFRAPFMFGVQHVHEDVEWGKAFTLQDSPAVTSIPSYLGWPEGSNSNGGQAFTSPQYVTAEHEYMYLASDNSGSAPDCNSGFIDVQGHTGWYRIFTHRHGRTIWVASIDINGVQQPPSVDRRIHAGDRVAVYFVNNRDYGNRSDNYGSWSYWCRPVLRQLDV